MGLSVFLTTSAYMSMLQLVHVLSNPYRGDHDNFNADSWLVQQEYSMFYTMRVWACFPRAPDEASPEAGRQPGAESPQAPNQLSGQRAAGEASTPSRAHRVQAEVIGMADTEASASASDRAPQ